MIPYVDSTVEWVIYSSCITWRTFYPGWLTTDNILNMCYNRSVFVIRSGCQTGPCWCGPCCMKKYNNNMLVSLAYLAITVRCSLGNIIRHPQSFKDRNLAAAIHRWGRLDRSGGPATMWANRSTHTASTQVINLNCRWLPHAELHTLSGYTTSLWHATKISLQYQVLE